GAFPIQPPKKTAATEAPGKDKDRKETPVVEMGRKLATPVTLTLEPAPLKEVLDLLREKYGLTILVDQGAFANDLSIPDVEAQQVNLARVAGVRLETVLNKLLAQVQGGFLVKADHIEITSLGRVQMAVWGTVQADETAAGPAKPRPRMPLVHADLHQRPLDL